MLYADDFDGTTLDPAWEIVDDGVASVTAGVAGSGYVVSDLAATTPDTWATHSIRKTVAASSDFTLDARFSWDSAANGVSDMLRVGVRVLTDSGAAEISFADESVAATGGERARGWPPVVLVHDPGQGTGPLAGTIDARIVRTNGTISFAINGVTFPTTTVSTGNVTAVELFAAHYDSASGTFSPVSFGSVSFDGLAAPGPQGRLAMEAGEHGVTLKWRTNGAGSVYQLQASGDLDPFTNVGLPLFAESRDAAVEIDRLISGPRRFYRFVADSGINAHHSNRSWMQIATGACVPYNPRRGFFYDGRSDDREWVCGGMCSAAKRGTAGAWADYWSVGGAYSGMPLKNPDGSWQIGGAWTDNMSDMGPNDDGSGPASGDISGLSFTLIESNGGSFPKLYRSSQDDLVRVPHPGVLITPQGNVLMAAGFDGVTPDCTVDWLEGAAGFKHLVPQTGISHRHDDRNFSIGAGSSGSAQNPDGTYVVGGASILDHLNPDGSYSVGGLYPGIRLQADHSYNPGGAHTGFLTDVDGRVYAGALYNGWQRGSDGKVCVGGRFTGCVQNQ